jgi:hypothetical protein
MQQLRPQALQQLPDVMTQQWLRSPEQHAVAVEAGTLPMNTEKNFVLTAK